MMLYERNEALVQEIVKQVREEYFIEKPLPHATELIYCLTRSFFDRQEGRVPPTEKEILTFSIGFGLERVLIGKVPRDLADQRDGIYYSPDFLTVGGELAELKTTRYSSKKTPEELPETWLKQIKAYCYGKNVMEYHLAVLHIIDATLNGWTLYFDEEELRQNWLDLVGRRDYYLNALQTGKVPESFKWNEEWECKYCRYLIKCEIGGRL